MIKQVWLVQCDFCGKEEHAKIVSGQYNETETALPDGWGYGYTKAFHCCPECHERLSRSK